MADLKALAEELVNLSVKDVKELADILKEEYGIEPAAAAVAVAAAPAAGGAAAAEEKSEFDVILKSAGAAKLQVVKVVKWFFIEQDIRYWNHSGRDMTWGIVPEP